MTIISAIVLLGILIFVHELGHFLFAKLLGVKVLKFSLGFGRKLIGGKIGETEYQIAAIPLGGYVKMFGEESGEEMHLTGEECEEPICEEDKKRAFSFQPVWKRFLIVLSGPVFNIVFAALVFIVIYLNGIPALSPDVGKIGEGSPAQEAGLMTGDHVVAINGQPMQSWDDVEVAIDESGGKDMLFAIERRGSSINVTVVPQRKSIQDIFGDERQVWSIGASPLLTPTVHEVLPGTPADKAGLTSGDVIVLLEGTAITRWDELTAIVHKSPGIPLAFTIQRGTETFERRITPEKKTVRIGLKEEEEIGLIGIKPQTTHLYRSFPLGRAIELGIQKTGQSATLIFVFLVKLVQRAAPADTIGGPIMIVHEAGKQAAEGPLNFFMLMAVISINLGIINLFPIPILDGGHLMFLGYEAVRRKPLGERAVIVAQKVGLALILMLVALATYNDIHRYGSVWVKWFVGLFKGGVAP